MIFFSLRYLRSLNRIEKNSAKTLLFCHFCLDWGKKNQRITQMPFYSIYHVWLRRSFCMTLKGKKTVISKPFLAEVVMNVTFYTVLLFVHGTIVHSVIKQKVHSKPSKFLTVNQSQLNKEKTGLGYCRLSSFKFNNQYLLQVFYGS